MGVAVFGVPVLMILSSLTVTNEYRSGHDPHHVHGGPEPDSGSGRESRCRGGVSGIYPAAWSRR